MNDWHNFLQNLGARLQDGVVLSFDNQDVDNPVLSNHTCLFDLSHLGILRIIGESASQLLQGQTTCDFRELDNKRSLIGALCTPRGRAIASFRALRLVEGEISLLLPTDQVDAVKECLDKYSAFSKVTIEPGANMRALGLYGPQARQICQRLAGCTELAIDEICHRDTCTVICLSGDRYILLTPDDSAQTLWADLATQASPSGTPLWTLLDIRDGMGELVAATREMFIPQMINLQARQGISFTKGCYTGQEVVARMHYLGKLKRRMYRLQTCCNELPEPGTPCYLPDKQQSIGNVVMAARVTATPSDHQTNDALDIELLAVLTEDAAAGKHLRFGDSEPKTVKLLTIPYSLEIP